MTDTDKSQAQAMLNAAIAQRNQAMDQCIHLPLRSNWRMTGSRNWKSLKMYPNKKDG